jgi:aminoglycoside phosphotransferase (APT) family kinase protein
VAWNLLPAETRGVFRAALPVDDATWARGRGWALSVGLIALPYYQHTNPVLAGISRTRSPQSSPITSGANGTTDDQPPTDDSPTDDPPTDD